MVASSRAVSSFNLSRAVTFGDAERAAWILPTTRIVARRFWQDRYWVVRVADHILLGSCEIFEHRLVMTDKIGRKLVKGEVVHHHDENVHNNHPDNLELTNQSAHASYHGNKNRDKMRQLKLGTKATEGTKEKHRKRMLGNKHLLGHRHSEETKLRLSIVGTGRVPTTTAVENMRAAAENRSRSNDGRFIREFAE